MEQVKSDIDNYLRGKEINMTLLANYTETLEQYILYIENNKSINLNNFDIKNLI